MGSFETALAVNPRLDNPFICGIYLFLNDRLFLARISQVTISSVVLVYAVKAVRVGIFFFSFIRTYIRILRVQAHWPPLEACVSESTTHQAGLAAIVRWVNGSGRVKCSREYVTSALSDRRKKKSFQGFDVVNVGIAHSRNGLFLFFVFWSVVTCNDDERRQWLLRSRPILA